MIPSSTDIRAAVIQATGVSPTLDTQTRPTIRAKSLIAFIVMSYGWMSSVEAAPVCNWACYVSVNEGVRRVKNDHELMRLATEIRARLDLHCEAKAVAFESGHRKLIRSM